MELNQENIEKVAEVLRMRKLEESMLKVQSLSELAKTLIAKYPNLSAEEIGQAYDLEMENKELENKEKTDDDELSLN